MFEKILVATDGSQEALKAVTAAAELALLKPEAKVTLLTVTPPVPSYVALQLRENDLDPAALQNQYAEEIFEGSCDPLKARNVSYTTQVAVGDPADEICRVAEAIGADLIIVGRRGLSGVRELLAGSVSSKVVHHAPCSVLVTQ